MVEILESSHVKELETTHGYFKMDEEQPTTLNLRPNYDKSHVKWLYFTAMTTSNPQRRAWLHAIRGPAFGRQNLHGEEYMYVNFFLAVRNRILRFFAIWLATRRVLNDDSKSDKIEFFRGLSNNEKK